MAYNYVITMVSTIDEAKLIAKNLVTKRLAACTNIISGVTSVYEWKNEICCEDEFILLIKTKKDLFDEVKKEILAHHTYELPAVVSVPIENGHLPFLQWIEEKCKK